MRARALVGKQAAAASSNDGPHWTKQTAKERLLEVMGRMRGDSGLREKLLLHGPSIAHDYERLKPHFGKSGKNFHLFVVNFM